MQPTLHRPTQIVGVKSRITKLHKMRQTSIHPSIHPSSGCRFASEIVVSALHPEPMPPEETTNLSDAAQRIIQFWRDVKQSPRQISRKVDIAPRALLPRKIRHAKKHSAPPEIACPQSAPHVALSTSLGATTDHEHEGDAKG